jgi:mannose-6-phosphate isomerase-like protein (cupin superfamily)
MNFIRSIDWNHPSAELPGGYKGQVLYYGESCLIIATLVPPGVEGPARHVHPTSDQVYVITEGEITIELGHSVERARKDSAIYIPAGTPHHNWNESEATETHIEVIAPGVSPIQRLSLPAESSTSTEGGDYYIRPVDETVLQGEPAKLQFPMTFDWLTSRELGPQHASIYIAQLLAGGHGPRLHIHDFDQFYFVLEGKLAVQIGLKEYEVGPGVLVVLPAGVPHRQWNPATVRERHIAVLVPEPARPSSEEPWDVPIEMREVAAAGL